MQLLSERAETQTATVYLQFKDSDLREMYDKWNFNVISGAATSQRAGQMSSTAARYSD